MLPIFSRSMITATQGSVSLHNSGEIEFFFSRRILISYMHVRIYYVYSLPAYTQIF